MQSLPSGTVSLLFTDIEGSTGLISRLGSAYGDALDGQRDVLRKAWSENGGVELGVEGDSFFVAFQTAPDAVAAAAQAQRDLASYPWPAGMPVRVRMGVHTGTPTVHGDSYVGMDVHRAARIASAAHGGQVVLSSSTTALVEDALPPKTALRDLGAHHLKDLPRTEHLHQLTIEGLPSEFPPLRAVGATSRLPEVSGTLVGRDDELSYLVGVLRSGSDRLLTFTGAPGCGKTRLAIAVAEAMSTAMADGVYFVSLASVTRAEMAWSDIAEGLGLAPERRADHDVFAFLAGRRALVVLDNLEQLPSSSDVVRRLLAAAPSCIVVATSRRPLHLLAELEHTVLPLVPPTSDAFDRVSTSSAVELFTQHAARARPGFAVTPDNAADVAALTRRLDGLPLALELAAARMKLLSPKALLNRIDGALEGALDLAPTRNTPAARTLRSTIAISYELLDSRLQTFFRRLGVFAGGASLDGLMEVAAADLALDDPLDSIADLVDTSLVTVGEDADGEPRVEILETLRAFARDRLREAGELEEIGERHAMHYLGGAESIGAKLVSDEYWQARAFFETEDRNLREALAWALPTTDPGPGSDRSRIGLLLCAAIGPYWSSAHGYLVFDGLPWLERALSRSGGHDSREHTRCLTYAGVFLLNKGDLDTARDRLTESVEMSRRLEADAELAMGLDWLGVVEARRGENETAMALFEEAVRVARASGDKAGLYSALHDFSMFLQTYEGDNERSLELNYEALRAAREIDSPYAVMSEQQNIACTLRLTGRLRDAHDLMRSVLPDTLTLNVTANMMFVAEDYAAILAELGHSRSAARLLGAADALHERSGIPRLSQQEAEIAGAIARARTMISSHDWKHAYESGRDTPIYDVIAHAYAVTAP
jgi:predicted ATPase/class 3 adenylate cyclase